MAKVTDLNEKFLGWFLEMESFSFRAQRFLDDATIEDVTKRQDILMEWLRNAYLKGARDMAQDTIETLGDYGAAVAGCDAELIVPSKKYDDAAESLTPYFAKILDEAETNTP